MLHISQKIMRVGFTWVNLKLLTIGKEQIKVNIFGFGIMVFLNIINLYQRINLSSVLITNAAKNMQISTII